MTKASRVYGGKENFKISPQTKTNIVANFKRCGVGNEDVDKGNNVNILRNGTPI